MERTRTLRYSIAFGATLGAFGVLAPTEAQTFSLVSQARSVSGFVGAFQCDGGFFYDQKQAAGFELFDATAKAVKSCPDATSQFTAEQFSLADAQVLFAYLDASSVTQAGPQNGMYAIASSNYSVDFDVTSAMTVTLKGSIAVDGVATSGPGAQVTLFDAANQIIFTHELWLGVPATVKDFDQTLVLAPGAYRLWMLAHSDMYANNAAAAASASAVLEPTKSCPGDVHGDGKTCQSDLGALLAAFGTCVGEQGFEPPANLVVAGASATCVNQADLGALLADYGCGGCP
jgi:hypothetical protein